MSVDPSPSPSRLVLISPSFFGYERDIAAEFERQGFDVTFIDERPSNTAFARAVMRVRRDLLATKIDRHFRQALRDLGNREIHVVLVVKGETVPRWFLEELRRRNPEAKFIYYTYDSVANAPNAMELRDCFGKMVSFDRADVAAHQRFQYLPLFFTDDYAPSRTKRRTYDLSFVGTLHSDRFAFAQTFLGVVPRPFRFFYVQARWYFAVIKYVTREHSQVRWKDVSFRPMSRKEIAETFRESHAVLDMQRSGQSGLTMRTFEVLASGAVLVTSNAAIVHEPFYDEQRIVVVPERPSVADAERLRARLAALPVYDGPPNGFERYGLANWAQRLLRMD